MPHFRFMNLMRITLGVTMAVLSTAGNVAISQSSKPSKKAQKAFAEALEAYRFLSYDLAVSHLDKAIHKSPEYAEAWFLKAQIYQDMDHPQLEATLVQALALDANLFPHGWVELAHVQWELGKYEEGLASLERLDALEMSRLAGDALTKREWVEAGLRFSVDAVDATDALQEASPMRGQLNTTAQEYYGALDLSGTHMVLTRTDITDSREVMLPGVAGGEDFFESFKQPDGTWTAPVPLAGVNTPLNEGAPALSGDGKVMVFTACETPRDGYGPRRGKGSCDLFESRWDNDAKRWSVGSNLGAPNSAGWESQPTLSADGNTLVFARSEKGHLEPSDLVVSHRLANGGWSSPKALSGKVNTSYSEESPFLHPDGKTLYFSSDGHPGFGKLDVFMSQREKDGTWGTPTNLGAKVNSPGKDNSLMVAPRGGVAMFATTRNSGNLDFWEVVLPEEAQPIEVATLRGVVLDASTGEALDAEVAMIDLETGQAISRTRSNREEGFVIPLPGLGNYSFEASAEGHVFGMTTYAQQGGESLNRSPFVQIDLEPIVSGQSFTLEAIQFESGLARLSSEYQAGCERLAQWMLDNPLVDIEVEGHTDNVGSVPFNMQLSLDRAEAVKEFLLDRGVYEARILTEGRGPLDPIADNDSEEGRAANRRVQIVILD